MSQICPTLRPFMGAEHSTPSPFSLCACARARVCACVRVRTRVCVCVALCARVCVRVLRSPSTVEFMILVVTR